MSSAQVAGVEVDTRHWIGGHRVASDTTFEDVSPLDGTVIAHVSPRRSGRGRRRGGGREGGVRHLVAHLARRAGRRAAPRRRRRRGADRGARAGRDARQRLAAALAPARGHAPRRDEHPVLRRLPARAVAPGLRDARAHATTSRGTRRESPRSSRRGTPRSCSPPGASARRSPPATPWSRSRRSGRRSPRRCSPTSRTRPGLPDGVFNVVQGSGHRGGGTAGRARGRASHLLHRVGADVDQDRRVRGAQRHAGELRARGQVAAARLRRRRPRPRGRPGGRAVRQLRPGLPGRGPPARAGRGLRRVPRRGSSSVRPGSRRATRATRRPTSGRWSSRTHFERVDGFVKRAIADGATVILGGEPHHELNNVDRRLLLPAHGVRGCGPDDGDRLPGGLRPGAHAAALRHRGGGRGDGERHRLRPRRHARHRRPRARRARVRRSCAPARCGSTASSSATCPRPSAAAAGPASAARAASGRSTSTAT